MKNSSYQVWQCSIYLPEDSVLPRGADFPPRAFVIEFFEKAGFPVVACGSGWGGGILKVDFNGQTVSDKLFERIKHGDSEHQGWLKTELDKFFSGE